MTQQPETQWTPDGPLLPYPGRPEPGPGRSKLWLWILLSVIFVGLIAVGSWGISQPRTATTHTVVYTASADSVTGSGRSGMLTLETENGGTSQAVVDLPFSGTSTTFHRGDFLYISVQNQQPAGSVTCRITVDGKVVSENTSDGGYTIATCQGKVS